MPLELVKEILALGRLPVVNFAAGGVATPADAALMMQMGCDGVFVGSGIFKSGNPADRAKVRTTHYHAIGGVVRPRVLWCASHVYRLLTIDLLITPHTQSKYV